MPLFAVVTLGPLIVDVAVAWVLVVVVGRVVENVVVSAVSAPVMVVVGVVVACLLYTSPSPRDRG